ncbi:hypothetical protein ASPWEDRAFT_36462 [Aspergillus wentii DTO 134E9]|uniref:Delta 8-(E)-sphingolipid desaturase n=1 Tax=Aspergillus wentii DTO 134E9 TaxID=1073089 RepID=A0A1L9RV84_ASPWE|nr:uncharacterized protein ASPWEDRAFT_36462 [Aspergillus wentii DTO 134E9]OJJ38793.1 hypothetical protein ASPWEDRAFT_36462 [Aspergillus wentii DTO 134E9]
MEDNSSKLGSMQHETAQATDHLPHIPASQVQAADGKNGSRLWIVIDDIVYDVTEFCRRHPGGEMPLRHFAGQSCSWQFRQIHGPQTLERYRELQVGRTDGVPNPYEKPKPKFSPRLLWSRLF